MRTMPGDTRRPYNTLGPLNGGVLAMMRFVAVLSLCLVASVPAADWPQFLGPNRDGHSTETGLLTSFPKDGPKVIWQHDVGDGYSTPVISGNQLFVFHRQGDKDVVDCLDPQSGKTRWSFSYATDYSDRLGKGDGPRATPVTTAKHVYTLS